MGFSGKAKSSNEGWGLGLLLVFFPDEDDNNKYIDKRNNNKKLSYASLFVPTISPSINNPRIELGFPRRWLAEKNNNNYKAEKSKNKRSSTTTMNTLSSSSSSSSSFALQGLGTQFRRGTRAMSDLVVAHLTEDTRDHHLRLFIRALHRSGLTARADVLFIFPSSSSSSSSSSPTINSPNFTSIIHQENQSFLTLIHQTHNKNNKNSSFDATQFVNKKEKQGGEPIWGQKPHINHSNNNNSTAELTESTQLSYGSVVGFEAAELDPENSLSGFTENNKNPSMRLRRWACYPMLLGRVRRNFKHVMLADVKNIVVLGDPLAGVRTRSAESVSVWTLETLVQAKRTAESDRACLPAPTIRVRVKHGSSYHEIYINSQATFGELKKMLAGPTGVHPQDQKLLFKDTVRSFDRDDREGERDREREKNRSRV